MDQHIDRLGESILDLVGSQGEKAVQVDDETVVSIISLAPGKIGEIAHHFNATLNDIVFFPMNRIDAFEFTVLACFEKAKKKPPWKRCPDSRELLKYYVEIPSTLPATDPTDLIDEEEDEADPTEASSTGS